MGRCQLGESRAGVGTKSNTREIAEKTIWRDARLAALAAHKRSQK
jgi:hypothetical protein